MSKNQRNNRQGGFDLSDYEVEHDPNAATSAQVRAMATAMAANDTKDRGDRLAFATAIVGREVESSKDLNKDEAGKVNYCPTVGERVLTANRGWVAMGDVVVGDRVFAPDGAATKVTEVHPRHCGARWRVTFSDGETVDTAADHSWRAFDRALWTKIHRRRDKSGDWSEWWVDAPLVTASGMSEELRDYRGMTNWTIPNTAPLMAPEADLPIDPYLFGYWLGDGFWSQITCHADDVGHITQHIESVGWIATNGVSQTSSWVRASIPGTRSGWAGRTTDSFPNRLRALGVWDKGAKTVPASYLNASIEQRRALLAGLIDSDGSMTRGGQAVFTNTNRELIAAVYDLVVSLGAKATIKPVAQPVEHWRVTFTPSWCPFRMKRHGESWDQLAGKPSVRRRSRTVKSIQQVADRAEFVCITVDHPSHLFLIGRGLVPTHSAEATSEKNQVDTWNWYTSTAYSRLLPRSPLAIVQTRWAELDLLGRVRANDEKRGDWCFAVLPAIAETNETLATVIGERWVRYLAARNIEPFPWHRAEGEALWPEIEPGVAWFDEAEYAQIRAEVGEVVWAGLYQQRPAPLEGGLFKRTNWLKVDAMPAGKATLVRRWDLAASTSPGADFTASCLMAIHHQTRMIYILDVTRDRLETTDVETLVRATAEDDRETYGDVYIRVEREPGSTSFAIPTTPRVMRS